MLRLVALLLLSSSSHMHHAHARRRGLQVESRDLDGIRDEEVGPPAEQQLRGATTESAVANPGTFQRHPHPSKSFLRLRDVNEGRSTSATGRVSGKAPKSTADIPQSPQRGHEHDFDAEHEGRRHDRSPVLRGEDDDDDEVAVATSPKSQSAPVTAPAATSLLAMSSKPSEYKDYDLGKTNCDYWVDIVDGDYYLGDICEISLSMQFYKDAKKWPAKQTVADITSKMDWAFSTDRFPVPPAGINQALLNTGATQCMPAFDFAQRMREALFMDDANSPYKGYHPGEYPLSDDAKKKKLSYLGVDSVAELEKLIKADFRGQQLTSADPGAGDPEDGERRDYDIRKDFMWMCHVICDLLDGKQGNELLTCATYTYVELDAVDENGEKHKWPAGGCWPKFKQVQKRDKVFKKSRMASVCIERACGVKIREDGTYEEDAKDKQDCLDKYPMIKRYLTTTTSTSTTVSSSTATTTLPMPPADCQAVDGNKCHSCEKTSIDKNGLPVITVVDPKGGTNPEGAVPVDGVTPEHAKYSDFPKLKSMVITRRPFKQQCEKDDSLPGCKGVLCNGKPCSCLGQLDSEQEQESTLHWLMRQWWFWLLLGLLLLLLICCCIIICYCCCKEEEEEEVPPPPSGLGDETPVEEPEPPVDSGEEDLPVPEPPPKKKKKKKPKKDQDGDFFLALQILRDAGFRDPYLTELAKMCAAKNVSRLDMRMNRGDQLAENYVPEVPDQHNYVVYKNIGFQKTGNTTIGMMREWMMARVASGQSGDRMKAKRVDHAKQGDAKEAMFGLSSQKYAGLKSGVNTNASGYLPTDGSSSMAFTSLPSTAKIYRTPSKASDTSQTSQASSSHLAGLPPSQAFGGQAQVHTVVRGPSMYSAITLAHDERDEERLQSQRGGGGQAPKSGVLADIVKEANAASWRPSKHQTMEEARERYLIEPPSGKPPSRKLPSGTPPSGTMPSGFRPPSASPPSGVGGSSYRPPSRSPPSASLPSGVGGSSGRPPSRSPPSASLPSGVGGSSGRPRSRSPPSEGGMRLPSKGPGSMRLPSKGPGSMRLPSKSGGGMNLPSKSGGQTGEYEDDQQ